MYKIAFVNIRFAEMIKSFFIEIIIASMSLYNLAYSWYRVLNPYGLVCEGYIGKWEIALMF